MRALLLFCQAHTCYLTFLMAVNRRFEATESLRKERVQRNIEDQIKTSWLFCQIKNTKHSVHGFHHPVASQQRSWSRNPKEMDRGEGDRRSLNLSPMSSNNVVQNTAMTLSKRRVRLNFEKYDFPLYGVEFIITEYKLASENHVIRSRQ